MEKFAGYGFNKSHAAAYALLAYQTAWLKAHYPAEFMAANLSLGHGRHRQGAQFYRRRASASASPSCRRTSTRPTIASSRSTRSRSATGWARSRAPAGAIEAIVAARERAARSATCSTSAAASTRAVNRRAVEALIKAGAFDRIDTRRASLAASVAAAMEHAENGARTAAQVSLFGSGDDAGLDAGVELIVTREWTETERLVHERGSLGFYLSGHPYRAFADELAPLVQQKLGALKPTSVPLRIAGVVSQLRMQTSRRGKMAFVTLDDGKDSGRDRRLQRSLRPASTSPARRPAPRRRSEGLAADERRRPAPGPAGHDRSLVRPRQRTQEVRARAAAGVQWLELGPAPARHAGALPQCKRKRTLSVTIRYRNHAAAGEIELGDAWKVTLDDHLVTGLRDWLQPENVTVVY